MRAWIHASEVLTGEGVRSADGVRPTEEHLGRIDDGAIVTESAGKRERIAWVGPTRKLPKRYVKAKRTNLRGERAVLPGFVDAHTHLVFAGDRSDEFADRCGGATYQEIAARGGGITKTVFATRSASEAELLRLGRERLKESIAWGVRTIELKSGYGLDWETERKQLRVAGRLQKEFAGQIEVHSTFLGAHAFPPAADGLRRDQYLSALLETMLPGVVKGKFASACDVFVDEGYFTRTEGERLLREAKRLGLALHVHADELGNTGSAELAASVGALSADHCLQISGAGIGALARSETVAVLLPGTAFFLKAGQAPAREMIDRGVRVALATDFNPGTCPTLNLPLIMTMAALQLGMSRAEIFAAVTYNGARALGVSDRRGTLEVGMDAAVFVAPFKRFDELYYRAGWR